MDPKLAIILLFAFCAISSVEAAQEKQGKIRLQIQILTMENQTIFPFLSEIDAVGFDRSDTNAAGGGPSDDLGGTVS